MLSLFFSPYETLFTADSQKFAVNKTNLIENESKVESNIQMV